MARIEADLAVLGRAQRGSLPGEVAMDLAARASAAAARLVGVRLSALTAVEDSGVWGLDGSRAVGWAPARREDASVSTIKAEITLAKHFAVDLPLTGAALQGGQLSADKAKILARLAPTSAARRAALADPDAGEAFLLGQARQLDPWAFTKAVTYWAYRVDPARRTASTATTRTASS